MMVLGNWSDGYRLVTDPRREDPLYYYLKADEWPNAIGLEVVPPYEPMQPRDAYISVFREHQARERQLSDADRGRIYERCIPAIARRLRKCKALTVVADKLGHNLAAGPLAGHLANQGFALQDQNEHSATWIRA